MFSDRTQFGPQVLLFQITSRGMQLLNSSWEELPGMTPNRWLGISRGGWRSLVPAEYHSEVEKLTLLPLSESYTVVEFPVYWQDSIVWLLVFAAAVPQAESGRKVVGLVQDVTREREGPWALSSDPEADLERKSLEATIRPIHPTSGQPKESVEDLCHDLSGPLTSILVNCEMLMEDECPPPVRQRLEGIFSEAMQINHQLRTHRRDGAPTS